MELPQAGYRRYPRLTIGRRIGRTGVQAIADLKQDRTQLKFVGKCDRDAAGCIAKAQAGLVASRAAAEFTDLRAVFQLQFGRLSLKADS
jgi:hypothetical protein